MDFFVGSSKSSHFVGGGPQERLVTYLREWARIYKRGEAMRQRAGGNGLAELGGERCGPQPRGTRNGQKWTSHIDAFTHMRDRALWRASAFPILIPRRSLMKDELRRQSCFVPSKRRKLFPGVHGSEDTSPANVMTCSLANISSF